MNRFGLALVAAWWVTSSHASGAVGAPSYQLAVNDGLVSLRVAEGSLVEVVQDLGRRAGFEVIVDPASDVRVSASFEGVALREAIRRVCKTTGYIEVLDPQTGKVSRLVLTPAKAAPVARITERHEPLSPRPAMQEQPVEVEPEPVEAQPAEPEQEAEVVRGDEKPVEPPPPPPPPEPQIFPEPFGGSDERPDDRRRRSND